MKTLKMKIGMIILLLFTAGIIMSCEPTELVSPEKPEEQVVEEFEGEPADDTATEKQQHQLFGSIYPTYVEAAAHGVNNALRWGIRFDDGTVKMYPQGSHLRQFDELPIAVRELAAYIAQNVGAHGFGPSGGNLGGIFQMDSPQEIANFIGGHIRGDILDAQGNSTNRRAETILAEWCATQTDRVDTLVTQLQSAILLEPPRDFNSWAEGAITWANARLDRRDWNGRCLRFVADAFRQGGSTPAGWSSAWAAAEALRGQGLLNSANWKNAPRGALIFFDGRTGGLQLGHVGIYLGDGRIIHAYGRVRIDAISSLIGMTGISSYVGWAFPPEKWRPRGSLRVTIEPAAARTAGARWRLTSGPDTGWKNSGAIVGNLPVGTYTVTFSTIAGWTRPPDANVTIIANQRATSTGTYTQVHPAPTTPTITNITLPEGTVRRSYSTTLTATGGTPPYTWLLTSGSLPAGLTLRGSRISGTPTRAGTSTFTVQVRDNAGQTARRSLSITVRTR